MKKKNWIFPAFIILLLSAALITEGASSSAKKCESTCCSKKMNSCPEKNGNQAGSEFIPDNLSHQFL